jgi:glycine cleavage system H lipoate-binding protein
MKSFAFGAPVIEVKDGTATVGISVMKASAVDGEWENVELQEDDTSVEADTVKVVVPADEKAAFYKFVVPNKQ